MEDYLASFQKFEKTLQNFQKGLSVDCTIIGYKDHKLSILLLKWKKVGSWCLPGGFIFKNESTDDAACRVLEERTGLTNVFLKQFKTFGSMERTWNASKSNIALTDKMLKMIPVNDFDLVSDWFKRRFISIGYYALLDIDKCETQPDMFSEECRWFPVDELPDLILDHNEIAMDALDQLRIQANFLPIGINLLPHKFTMKELRLLYEAVLHKPLDRSNFQRKILNLNILIRHEKKLTGAQNKAPYLYSFNRDKYEKALTSGIGLFSV
ncbi:MAG: NUDIX domain-containing protein [Bacteroidota bacterium]